MSLAESAKPDEPKKELELDAEHLSHDIKSLRELAYAPGPTTNVDYSQYEQHAAGFSARACARTGVRIARACTYWSVAHGHYLPSIEASAHLRKCLELNRQYQNILRIELKRIEQVQLRNSEAQKKVQGILNQGRATQRKSTSVAFKKSPGQPYFVDADGTRPIDNPDTVARREKLKTAPIGHKFRKWNKSELKHLANGVQQQNQRMMLETLMESYQRNEKPLEAFNQEMEHIKSLPEQELERSVEGIDWDALARAYVPTRSGVDCKIQWLNNEDPKINANPWTKEEDKSLTALVAKYKGHNWEQISKEIGTCRTAHQCFTRYQRRLNTSMKKSKWTSDDDNILLESVRRYGEKNWQQVATCLEGRTAQQCLHRYKKALDPTIRRGKWTPDEDRMLEKAVQVYGCKNWSKIQQHVPGRTDVQCRERWVNVLNPELNSGPWAQEEDDKLKQAIQVHGLGKWAAVAQLLYPRTDNQCWRRWKALHADQAEDYKQSIKKRRLGTGEGSDGTTAEMEGEMVGKRKRKPRQAAQSLPEPQYFLANMDQHEAQLYEEGQSASLPLVFPCPVTFTALYRLLQCLEGETRTQFPTTPCLNHVNTNEFQVLASWFNSLFLFPLMVVFNGMVHERDDV
jgi:hypothetical protein